MLVEEFEQLLRQGWEGVFAQRRTLQRAMEHANGMICCFGRRTVSRTICAIGRQDQDWSADYKMFSRSPWEEEALFDPVIAEYVRRYPEGPIQVAFDDTKIAKRGKKIETAFWQRDPMSPPFHVNFIYGLRFAHASMLFPHYLEGDYSARALPVRFKEAPAIKKPGKRAAEEEKRRYVKMHKEQNLSVQFLEVMLSLRESLDAQGAAHRPLLGALDGSLCNRTIFKAPLRGIQLVARCRKDARLCFPPPAGSRRKYDPNKFTPEQVRQDESISWREARIHLGGAWRWIRYKEVNGVLWQRGAGRRKLRLLAIAPQPYKLSARSRINYRQPAYLLCTDTQGPIKPLIQVYFDRWQIEVNHRDQKSLFGVGQAQVHSKNAIPRQPAFAVATYSMLLLACLKAFGPGRTHHYHTLPKWRKNAKRPSILDLITLIRMECNKTANSHHLHKKIAKNTTMYAYT